MDLLCFCKADFRFSLFLKIFAKIFNPNGSRVGTRIGKSALSVSLCIRANMHGGLSLQPSSLTSQSSFPPKLESDVCWLSKNMMG